MGLSTDSKWDLTIDNRDGQSILAVEVKSKLCVSAQWAAQWRRNIFVHGSFPQVPYLLMAFPDIFFLWTPNQSYFEVVEPTYKIDATPIISPYCERANINPNTISEHSLELIIESWLSEIIHTDLSPVEINNSLSWLVQSGLYEAFSGGHFEQKSAA